jgi:hypothetical protein
MGALEDPFRKHRATLNPYRSAAAILLERVKWDASAESRRSRRRLRAIRERHLGHKAVIMCNGPSLLRTDLDSLRGVFVFGLNKINLLFERTSFRPSAIVSVNAHVIEQNTSFYNQTEIPLFLDSAATRGVRARSNVTFLHSSSVQKFARDCSVSVYQGYTVTFVALQLAFHMGFSEVALVGCDHNFAEKGPPNKLVHASGADQSHFDPRYFSNGMKWQLPDIAQSEVSYQLARATFEAFDRKIFNCTDGGLLDIFERKSLQSFLGS